MIRPFALFLAVGFLSAAAFLVVPDDPPGTPRLDDGETRASPLAAKSSIGCGPARRAPAHASARLEPRRYDDVVPKEEFVLEVVREDGRPMAGAEVRFVNQGLALDAVTDVNGRVRIEAQPETSAFVTVKRADCYTHTDVLALEPGLRRLVVPNRKTVAARVLVRGQTPREPIRIGYQLPFNLQSLSATSDAQGRVEFFNLPQNVEGTFTWPEGYRRDDGGPSPAAAWISTQSITQAEWTRAVAAATNAEATSSTGDTFGPNATRTFRFAPMTITLSGNINIRVQATTTPLCAFRNAPVPAAAHPEGGPALVGEVRVEGNVNTLNKVLAAKALDESIDEISRRIDQISEQEVTEAAHWIGKQIPTEKDIPFTTFLACAKDQNDTPGPYDVMKLVLGSAVAADVTEIRLIPTRTIPIRILDPSGAPVAAYVQVQGWCSFNANPFEGGMMLVLDEDVYASGLSSVIEVHWGSTGVLLPLENVSMTWNAAGAPSATVTVGYPPAIEPVVVSITDFGK